MKIYLIVFVMMFAISANTQNLDEKSFDFWIGEWDLTWVNADNSKGVGTNNITKVLDDKVIQENFVGPGKTPFKGRSLSVYNAKSKQWHQAWVDNGGGYFNFTGALEGDIKMFITEQVTYGDVKMIQRMIFTNITKDSLIWDWQSSKDDGKTWNSNWKINYQRKK